MSFSYPIMINAGEQWKKKESEMIGDEITNFLREAFILAHSLRVWPVMVGEP